MMTLESFSRTLVQVASTPVQTRNGQIPRHEIWVHLLYSDHTLHWILFVEKWVKFVLSG